MTIQEKARHLFQSACEICEGYSIDEECERHDVCPVYNLYLLAKQKSQPKIIIHDDYRGMQGYCDFDPLPRPEMI